jgi:hypothetical protein
MWCQPCYAESHGCFTQPYLAISCLLLDFTVTTSYLLHFASFFVLCPHIYYTLLPVVVEFVLYIC